MDISASLKRIFPSELGSAFTLEKVDAPLRERLVAWWQGRSVADIAKDAPNDGDDGDSKSAIDGEEQSQAKPRISRVAAEEDFSDDIDDGRFWTRKRIAVSEQLWGESQITPGGVERTLEMIGAFGLGTEVNVLNIGSGLGGAARRIAGKYQGWVTGYEQDPDLAAAAIARSEQAGLAKKAKIHHANFGEMNLRTDLFDCAFSRDVLYIVEDREDLLVAVQEGLKAHCPLLFTDYFVTKGREDDPTVRKWMEAEPAKVYPWNVEAAQEILCQTNFELRVVENISDTVRADIFAGWAGFVEDSEKTGIPPQLLETVLELAELWGHWVAALDSGAVTAHRIVALKI